MYSSMADNAELVDRMRKSGKSSFQDILVFNELSTLTRKANADPQAQLSAGLEGLMAVDDRLYSYGFSLAGYKFIGLAVSSINHEIRWFDQFAFFLLSCGFVVSCFSALLTRSRGALLKCSTFGLDSARFGAYCCGFWKLCWHPRWHQNPE